MKITYAMSVFLLTLAVAGCASYPESFVTNVSSDYHGNVIVEKTDRRGEVSNSTVPVVQPPSNPNVFVVPQARSSQGNSR